MSNTITLPLPLALTAFGAVMPHASTDAVTPVITTIQIAAADSDHVRYLYATDRYSVARYPLEEYSDKGDDGEAFLVPLAAAKFIRTLRPTVLLAGRYAADKYNVTVSNDDASVTVELSDEQSVLEQSRRFLRIKGNFPPVHRFFTTQDADTIKGVESISIGTPQLEKLITSQRIAGGGLNGPVKLEFFQHKTGAKKPQPFRVTAGKFEAMVQPNLDLR